MTESRTKRSAQNAGASILGQFVVLALGFVSRTVFIHHLGVELLGVQSLLVSLMALAAVADAGVGWALMYSLYKPLREDDHRAVAAVVRHAARWYRWIAVGTAVIGLATLPFLGLLVGDSEVEHLEVYYLIALAGLVLQYPMYHRVLLLEADQKGYRTKLITIVVNVVRTLAQIAVVVLWQDFALYLAIQAVSTVVVNAVVHRHVGRHYPYLRTPAELPRHERRDLGRSVRAMLVYRLSGLALNNSGPILISAMLGAVVLGYYSNYLLLLGMVLMPLEMAFAALVPSVGHLVASGDPQATRRVFDELQLLSILLYGTASVALLVTLEPMLRLWLGDEFVLSYPVALATVASFYIVGTQGVVNAFRGATGMFRDVQYVIALTAVLNLALALALGTAFGLVGILCAPILARLLTNAWIEPWFLLRRYLPGGTHRYFLAHASGAGTVVFTAGLLTLASTAPWFPSGLVGLLVSGLGACLTAPILLWVVFGRTEAGLRIGRRVTAIIGH